MTDEIKKILQAELKRLQSIFGRGHSFSIVYLPDKIRYGQNGGVLCGEVQNKCILIYESKEAAAVQTLYHEFIEAIFIVPMVKHCYEVMQHQRKMLMQKEQMLIEKDEIIHQMLMQLKENTVDGISMPLSKVLERTW